MNVVTLGLRLLADRRHASRTRAMRLRLRDTPCAPGKLHRIRISPADLQKRHLVGLLRSGNRHACAPPPPSPPPSPLLLVARSGRKRCRHGEGGTGMRESHSRPIAARRLVAVGRSVERRDERRAKGGWEKERERERFHHPEYAGS